MPELLWTLVLVVVVAVATRASSQRNRVAIDGMHDGVRANVTCTSGFDFDLFAPAESPEQAFLRAVLELADPPPPPVDKPLSTLLALRERYRDDFLGFCTLLEIVSGVPGQGLVPFLPNEVQLLFCEARSNRDVILKARQLGFTTIELARDIWFFLTRPSAVVKVVCQSISDHSALNTIDKRISVMLAALAKHGLRLDFATAATGHWRLRDADGAATLDIVEAGASAAAAEKKGRTDSVGRLHVTEAAFFEYAAKTLNALMASVAAPEFGSEVVFESTANGMGSDDGKVDDNAAGGPFFYALCQSALKGASGYALHFFSWMTRTDRRIALAPGEIIVPETERERQCVGMGATPEQIKWYRRELAGPGINGSQDKMDQEFATDRFTCFLVSGRSYFDRHRTDALLAAAQKITPLRTVSIVRPGAVGELRVWQDALPGRRYVLIADASEGTGGDRGTAQVWECATARHCATLFGQFKPPELARECEALGYVYNTALLCPERNNHGHAVIAEHERADPVTRESERDGILLALREAGGDRAKAAQRMGITVQVLARQMADLQITAAMEREAEHRQLIAAKRRYPRLFKDYDGKPGWITHEASRSGALTALEQVHREGKWSTPCTETLGEVRTFVVSKRGKAEAAGGALDDLVMTAAISWDVLGRVAVSPPRGMGQESLGMF